MTSQLRRARFPAFLPSNPARPLSFRSSFLPHAPGLQICRKPCIIRRNRLPIPISCAKADTSPSQSYSCRKSLPPLKEDQKVSATGLLFLAITYLWSIILFIPMLIAHPFVMWRDRATRRFHDFIAMAWMRWSFGSFLINPKIVNKDNIPPEGVPAVYVANHTSYLDIYSFAYLRRRIKYLSKAEIFKIPIVGWAMEMAGNVAVRRTNRKGQIEAYRKMVQVVKNGLSLVVFPEGTRSSNGKMRRFQAGAFRAAKQSNAPIVPVTILGTRESMPSWAWVPLRYPTIPISLVIHPAIESTNRSINELRDLAYKAIDSALPTDAQTRPYPKHR